MLKLFQMFTFIQTLKNSSFRLFYQSLAIFLVLGLVSCGSNEEPGKLNLPAFRIGANVTKIADIKPADNTENTVYIQGKVEKIAPLVKQKAYLIADATGKIWVVTNQGNLQVGQDVVFKGKIKYKSIPLAGQEYGEVYLEEE
ncbi:MAG: hypothetical protein EAZ76_14060 [Nostocales cyanobacterium]|nr:MAG: hypothetical protein EAZ87_22765 [Nostocales cyanobacterium]TAF12490.1 MAG: hypothetical protein EAZ76_14060 [Nostocales cyanobacterium]